MPQPRLTDSLISARIAGELALAGRPALIAYEAQKARRLNDLTTKLALEPEMIHSVARLLRNELDEVQEVFDRLDRGQYGIMENGFYREEVSRIWDTFCAMAAAGNKPLMPQSLPKPIGRFLISENRYSVIVRSCLHFKGGAGWMLADRRRGWAETIKDMFPRTLGRLTAPGVTA